MFYIFPHYMTSHITLHPFRWQVGITSQNQLELEMIPNSTRVFSLASKRCDCNQLPKPEIIAGFPLVFLNIQNRKRTKRKKKKSISQASPPCGCQENVFLIFLQLSLCFFFFRNAICHIFGPLANFNFSSSKLSQNTQRRLSK